MQEEDVCKSRPFWRALRRSLGLGVGTLQAMPCRGGEGSSFRVCQAFLRASFSSSRRLLSYHTLELACLCVRRACSVHLLECWHLQQPGKRPNRQKACLTGMSKFRAHSPQDIMSSALWVHLQLPRVAHHLPLANQHQQQSSQQPRHLHQPHNILKMEQKIAEMKPSKRYAPTSHHLSSTRQASHDVKQMGISPRK